MPRPGIGLSDFVGGLTSGISSGTNAIGLGLSGVIAQKVKEEEEKRRRAFDVSEREAREKHDLAADAARAAAASEENKRQEGVTKTAEKAEVDVEKGKADIAKAKADLAAHEVELAEKLKRGKILRTSDVADTLDKAAVVAVADGSLTERGFISMQRDKEYSSFLTDEQIGNAYRAAKGTLSRDELEADRRHDLDAYKAKTSRVAAEDGGRDRPALSSAVTSMSKMSPEITRMTKVIDALEEHKDEALPFIEKAKDIAAKYGLEGIVRSRDDESIRNVIAQINNELRHDLFGAALTEIEAKVAAEILLDPNLSPASLRLRLIEMRQHKIDQYNDTEELDRRRQKGQRAWRFDDQGRRIEVEPADEGEKRSPDAPRATKGNSKERRRTAEKAAEKAGITPGTPDYDEFIKDTLGGAP